MASTIKILPQYIANRIAAGEVVGRPESVVKELMENSVDASSTTITLRIKDAGKNFIQVTDDGIGMNQEDAILCFQRHSTSKIYNAEDLENIRTLGFRGEALASISSIAQVELRTGKSLEAGVIIKNHGNEIVECSPASGSLALKGTSITVKNLFFNTPARRNFLKSNQTEFKHIYDTFIRLSIAHPDITLNFINEDEEIFSLKKCDLRDRLIQLYGIKLVDNLIRVEYKTELISLEGFISKPSFNKKTKQDQILFLNKRFVISKSLSYAVHLAYGDLIEKGDYPTFFLFISADPKHFDVNVHPSKLEVKFDDEKAIFNFIRRGVFNALEKNDLTVEINFDENNKISFGKFESSTKLKTVRSFVPNVNVVTNIPFKRPMGSNIHEMFSKPIKDNKVEEKIEANKRVSGGAEKELLSRSHIDSFASKNTIWQFQRKYIMYQLENNLMVIDQHAAHERILYEQALDRLNSNANLSQQLLIPINIELQYIDYEIARSIMNELKALGFDIEMLAKGIKLTGIPSDVRLGDEGKILQEIIDEFKENDLKLKLDKRENLAKSYACKHAIRTGDVLKEDEMLNLIDKLFATDMPYVCPHGRPTIIKITMDELDKKFARTGF